MGSPSGRLLGPIALLVAVLAAVLLPSGCNKESSGTKLKVAATIVPLADFCREVGGDYVDVEVMVPPGASPHSFEPTSGQMKFLSDSKLFVTNGLELEKWAADVIKKVDNKNLQTVTCGKAVPASRLLRATEKDEYYDPHVWLDPSLAVYEVNAIRDALIKADPSHREQYTENTARYVSKLESLDREIKASTASFERKEFVALHPAWAYFAARYGLEQAGAIEELPGKEPSARQIADIVGKIRSLNITVVFAEPQFSDKAAVVIAREAGGGVVVKILDPLGKSGEGNKDAYREMMLENLKVMKEVLQ